MAQTLVSLMVHVIFSTKNREPLITPEIEPELPRKNIIISEHSKKN